MAGYRESERQVVITGIGVVSPIGIGIGDFWKSLESGTSGIRPSTTFPCAPPQCRIAGEVQNFVPSQFTKTREQKKALRVMCCRLASYGDMAYFSNRCRQCPHWRMIPMQKQPELFNAPFGQSGSR